MSYQNHAFGRHWISWQMAIISSLSFFFKSIFWGAFFFKISLWCDGCNDFLIFLWGVIFYLELITFNLILQMHIHLILWTDADIGLILVVDSGKYLLLFLGGVCFCLIWPFLISHSHSLHFTLQTVKNASVETQDLTNIPENHSSCIKKHIVYEIVNVLKY